MSSRGGEAAPTANGGGTVLASGAPSSATCGATRHQQRAHQPPTRRPRWVRGLLTLAGALAATLTLGTLTSTAGAQSDKPACLTSQAEHAAIFQVYTLETNLHNNLDNGQDGSERVNTRDDGQTHGSNTDATKACRTTRFGQAKVIGLPLDGAGRFMDRLRIWTDSDENDSYLRLYNAAGVVIAEDDDSGEGYNAFISLRLDGLPDRFAGEGSSNVPGVPVTRHTINVSYVYLEVGTYGPQEEYDTNVTIHIQPDMGAPWGSDLAGVIVPQLGGMPSRGVRMYGFQTNEAASAKRDFGELHVGPRFFNDTPTDQENRGDSKLDEDNPSAWYVTSPQGSAFYRSASSLSSHAAADHDGEHDNIRGSKTNANDVRWYRAFRGGDYGRGSNFEWSMVPVLRHDLDPQHFASTGDDRVKNDDAAICTQNNTETKTISLGYLSGAVNQYQVCMPKRDLVIVPDGLTFDTDDFISQGGGELRGSFRADSDRLNTVGYLVVVFDEDGDMGVWPVAIDANGAPHPNPDSALALAAGSSGGNTLTISGLDEGTDSPLHSSHGNKFALQILIDDETATMGATTCLDIPADVSDQSTWNASNTAAMETLEAELDKIRIPRATSNLLGGTVFPLAEMKNVPPPLRVGEFWVRGLDPWFTGANNAKVLNLNRATSHARNVIHDQYPLRRADHQLAPTGFNFVSGRCYAVSIRYMETHPGTGLAVGKGMKLRKEFIAP